MGVGSRAWAAGTFTPTPSCGSNSGALDDLKLSLGRPAVRGLLFPDLRHHERSLPRGVDLEGPNGFGNRLFLSVGDNGTKAMQARINKINVPGSHQSNRSFVGISGRSFQLALHRWVPSKMRRGGEFAPPPPRKWSHAHTPIPTLCWRRFTAAQDE